MQRVGWLLEGHAPPAPARGGGGGVVWGSAVSFPIGVSGEAAVADPGLSVRGGVLSRRYKRGWVREGALPPPAPGRGYGGAL